MRTFVGMNHHYLLAIGAGLTLAFGSSSAALAQTELPNRPDPATTPPTTTPATPAPYVAPAAPAPGSPANYYRPNAIGLELGWGGPYGGLGVHYAHMLTPNVDANFGVGIGVGGKIGAGVRYFFRPDRKFTTYLGASLARSGRVENVTATLNNETAVYSLKPSGVLHLRGGLRWQPGAVGLLATTGYGARFTGDPVVYQNTQYGQPSQQLRNLVNAITPGGIEFTVGMLITFGR